jgi:hypothetical protein
MTIHDPYTVLLSCGHWQRSWLPRLPEDGQGHLCASDARHGLRTAVFLPDLSVNLITMLGTARVLDSFAEWDEETPMSKDQGKNINDPARGQAETRGGEKPADWTGPLPAGDETSTPSPEYGTVVETVTEDGQ